MKRLLSYLKPHPVITILAPLFKMLEASFELFVPLVVARMIDTGILKGDTGYIWKMGGILVVLGIVGFSFSLTAQYFAAKSAISMGLSMRSDLFAHIHSFSFREIDTIGTSTLINRMTNDVNQVQNGVNMFLRLFLRSPFVVFGAMFMAFTVDVKAAMYFVYIILALMGIVFGLLFITTPFYKNVQQQLDKVLLSTRENLQGIRVVRAFNRQKSEMKDFQDETQTLYEKQLFVGKVSALLNPLTYAVINLGMIAILWSGGHQVLKGALTQGQVIALINYMSQILVELVKLANMTVIMSKSKASLNRVNAIFDIVPSITGEGKSLSSFKDTLSPAVEFLDVCFRYPDASEDSLSHLNFTAEKGQTVGIIGGTGSGKSTLVNLIPRFYDTSSGSVLINGENTASLNPASLLSRVGVVPQKAVLFSGNLRENMRWGDPDASDEEIYRALAAAQAKDFVEANAQGLDLTIAQNGGNLSGGQKQRLTIARALLRNPDILILDDSASALDFATDARLRKAIRECTGEMTVFLVSQRVATIRNADLILVLDDGHIVGAGTHEELVASNAVYQEICESQLSGREVAKHASS